MILFDIHRSGDVLRVSDVGGPHVVYLTDADGNILTTASGEWLSTVPVDYRGDIISVPDITQSIPDIFYGIAGMDEVTFNLANADNGIDDTWDEIAAEEELRGCRVVIRDSSENVIMVGVISNYTLGLESSITVKSRNDDIFNTLLPKALVTADTFTSTALNAGSPIPIIFGHVKNVPCANIQNNTDDDYYDYCIGYGTIQSLWIDHDNGRGVKRDGVLVPESEYTFYDGSQGSPFSGYSFIRFTNEQMNYNGGYYSITADVYGLELGGASADRNFANVIKAILNNSTWGLNQSVNTASFTSAATTLTTASWMCDRLIYDQEQARDVLNDMLLACRSWLKKNSDGEWEITVDGTGSSVATFGENDGYYDNCEVISCGVTSSDKAIKTAYVDYDNESYRISLSCHTGFGVDQVYTPRCISELATAEKLLSYIYGRSYYADKNLELKCGADAQNVELGNVVTITSASRGLSSATYRVIEITWAGLEYRLVCEAYNASIFDDQVISDPTSIDETGTARALQYFNVSNTGLSLACDGTTLSGDFNGVVNMAAQGGANVRKTAAQNISSDTYTVVDWDVEDWDTANEFNMTNNRFTVSEDTKLLVSAQIMWEDSTSAWTANTELDVAVYVNGGRTGISGCWVPYDYWFYFWFNHIVQALDLDENDYVEIRVYQTSGSTIPMNSTTSHMTFAHFQKVA